MTAWEERGGDATGDAPAIAEEEVGVDCELLPGDEGVIAGGVESGS